MSYKPTEGSVRWTELDGKIAQAMGMVDFSTAHWRFAPEGSECDQTMYRHLFLPSQNLIQAVFVLAVIPKEFLLARNLAPQTSAEICQAFLLWTEENGPLDYKTNPFARDNYRRYLEGDLPS